MLLQLTGGVAAEEAKLEADWQIVLVLLVVAALLHQMRSPAQLPLLIRLLIWPFTLLEAHLEALSLARAAVGALRAAAAADDSEEELGTALVNLEDLLKHARAHHGALSSPQVLRM